MANVSYTNEVAYQTYIEATNAVLAGKELVKVLYQEAQEAGQRARRETTGSFQEKLAAVREAVQPFRDRIAQVEAEIAQNYKVADENFDAWKGLSK